MLCTGGTSKVTVWTTHKIQAATNQNISLTGQQATIKSEGSGQQTSTQLKLVKGSSGEYDRQLWLAHGTQNILLMKF